MHFIDTVTARFDALPITDIGGKVKRANGADRLPIGGDQ